VGEVRALVERLRSQDWGPVGIRAGMICAENVVSGVQVIHQWGAAPLTGTALTSLQEAYLNHLFETVGHVSLTGIDRKAAGDAETRIDLHAVYTALLTLTPEEHERVKNHDALQTLGRRAASPPWITWTAATDWSCWAIRDRGSPPSSTLWRSAWRASGWGGRTPTWRG
jgi:hypothetical protein